MKTLIKLAYSICTLLILSGCATFEAQYSSSQSKDSSLNKDIEHSFYLIGDAGNSPMGGITPALQSFKEALEQAPANSTAIFLGDNIYEKGLPKESDPGREFAEYQLKVQTDAAKNFKGETIFIPGNHDWYADGPEGLKRQEKYIEDVLGKNTFLPENGCPIKRVRLDAIDIIVVDSHWYITNWDKHPTINDNCLFNTRQLFLDEFESLIKKAIGRTTIVAIHHPMYSNGPHGGQYSFGSHMTPIPVLGTLKNVVRKTGGIVDVDLQHKRYNELKRRLVTVAQHNEKVIFVSGHDHNLQYIKADNLHQIVSGSGSKLTPTRNVGGGQFSYGTNGYAQLDVYKDGSSQLKFYSSDEQKVVYSTEVIPPDPVFDKDYPANFPPQMSASIFTEEEVDVGGFYRFMWGDRYRKQYGLKISAPTVNLDTLFGGLKPVRKGGGNQSKSLRLEDKNGAQYVMRALRKQASQYLQAVVFTEQFVEGQFENTDVEEFTLDVFSGAHPYAPFVIGTLADGAQVYHTNPVLFYVPKQNAIGKYNDEFGDELYMIEEHTSEGHSHLASFGYQDKLLPTDEMMKKIHKDEDVVIDEASYIRARLFDMLIGDWDRHMDQWRWIEFKEDGKKVYRPMPRDRDQAFSKMSDGFAFGLTVALAPGTRLLRSYSEDLKDVKGVNIEPYPLDMELIQHSEKEVWDEQVKIIQEGVTDAVIEEAFLNFPEEVRDEDAEEIKRLLKARRSNLQKISDRYFELVNKFAVLKGTDKDDWFDIERLANGKTKVTAYRIKQGEKADIFHERIYDHEETKEIWIYALDDDDVFHTFGEGDHLIKVRLIGGQNNDTYNIENGKRLTYYDFKSKKSTVITNKGTQKFNDDYEPNVHDYKKLKNDTNALIPTIGFNPDDGIKIGVANTYTNYGFERNPFSSRNKVSGAYYFATNGYELNYNGEFANVLKNVNVAIDAQFNSPNYAINYFGLGNDTKNFEADENDGMDVNLDFNRVRIRSFHVMPSFVWRGQQEANFRIGFIYETNEVERTPGRFIETIPEDDAVFDDQNFYGVEASYNYENRDNDAFPTLGMLVNLTTGYKNNTQTSKGFGYIIPELGFAYKLEPSGKVVLATKFHAHFNLGNDFEFYQGAQLGAKTGLRGFRNERFTGKRAYVQTTDLRWNFGNLKTSVVPFSMGIYGGFDYGRVWVSNDTSKKWHNNFGGGFFINVVDFVVGSVGLFDSDDGLRFSFNLGFGF